MFSKLLKSVLLVLVMLTMVTPSWATSSLHWSGTTDQNLIALMERHDVLVIKDGWGGKVVGMKGFLVYLWWHPHKQVIIHGDCYSACTLLLGANTHNVHYTDRAVFHFHSSFTRQCPGPRKVISQNGNRRMMEVFDDDIRDWIRNSHAFASTRFTTMPPEVLVSTSGDLHVSELPHTERLVYGSTVSRPFQCPELSKWYRETTGVD